MIKWTDDLLRQLLDEYQSGKTQTELCHRWGLSKSHIRQRIMKAERRLEGGGPLNDRSGIIVRSRKPVAKSQGIERRRVVSG